MNTFTDEGLKVKFINYKQLILSLLGIGIQVFSQDIIALCIF